MKVAPKKDRIDAIGLIRGIAILGVLVIHFTSFSQIGIRKPMYF